MDVPVYKINILHVADVLNTDSSNHVLKYHQGEKVTSPTYSFLITGENIPPMLVDTGIKESKPDIMKLLGMDGVIRSTYKEALAKVGYTPEDIKVILHTHLHIDHAGNDDLFVNAKIIMPRKEIMFAVADIMDEQYPAEYITYLVEQIHVPGRVRLIDCDLDIAPGIHLELNEGHTWGSMNIHVNTSKGRAIMCGDVIYREELQCHKNSVFPGIEAHSNSEILPFGDRSTGNNWNVWAAKMGVVKVMSEADVVLPSHDPRVVKLYGYEI
ncbi:MBL fold hydrolase [Synergistales bacterium]|nr:MBL fold hydrolase [Synergistales bacterium]